MSPVLSKMFPSRLPILKLFSLVLITKIMPCILLECCRHLPLLYWRVRYSRLYVVRWGGRPGRLVDHFLLKTWVLNYGHDHGRWKPCYWASKFFPRTRAPNELRSGSGEREAHKKQIKYRRVSTQYYFPNLKVRNVLYILGTIAGKTPSRNSFGGKRDTG